MRGSRQFERELQAEAHSPEHRQRHRELHDGSDQHSDRVGVELGVAVEQRLQPDQQHDDHDVPHQRRDGRDREVVVGVEDPDRQPVDPEQYDDRERTRLRPTVRSTRWWLNVEPVKTGITRPRRG